MPVALGCRTRDKDIVVTQPGTTLGSPNSQLPSTTEIDRHATAHSSRHRGQTPYISVNPFPISPTNPSWPKQPQCSSLRLSAPVQAGVPVLSPASVHNTPAGHGPQGRHKQERERQISLWQQCALGHGLPRFSEVGPGTGANAIENTRGTYLNPAVLVHPHHSGPPTQRQLFLARLSRLLVFDWSGRIRFASRSVNLMVHWFSRLRFGSVEQVLLFSGLTSSFSGC
jgi:hypothetical protein